MKKEIINDFFINLAVYGSENSLSDIIAAAYNSNSEFRKLFFDFFFNYDKTITEYPSVMEREKSSGHCRFDLAIRTKDNNYIIENKRYNEDDHYDKYKKQCEEERIAFIANYDISDIKYKNKHTWKEFCDYINENSKSAVKKGSLISCILDYIKGVCNIMKEKQFNVMELKYLGYVIKVVEEILNDNGFKINRKAKGSSEEQIGFWVEKNERVYWFGFYFAEDDHGFWGEIYNSKLKTKSFDSLKYAEYSNESTEDSKWFSLKKAKFNLLNSEKKTYEQKVKILKDFIFEIEGVE